MTPTDTDLRDGIDIQKRPTRPGDRAQYRIVDNIDDERLEAAAERKAALGEGSVEDMKRALVGKALLAAIDELDAAGVRDAGIEIEARYDIPP